MLFLWAVIAAVLYGAINLVLAYTRKILPHREVVCCEVTWKRFMNSATSIRTTTGDGSIVFTYDSHGQLHCVQGIEKDVYRVLDKVGISDSGDLVLLYRYV